MGIESAELSGRRADGSFFETGCPVTATTCVPSAQDVKNPVAMAVQLQEKVELERLSGNISATLTLLDNLSTQSTFGVDNTNSVRRSFAPRASALGAAYGGFARQGERSLSNLNFQQLLTYSPNFGASELEVVGGYAATNDNNRGFEAQMQGFITDVFGGN